MKTLLILFVTLVLPSCATFTRDLAADATPSEQKAYLFGRLLIRTDANSFMHQRLILGLKEIGSGNSYGMHFRDEGHSDESLPVVIEVAPGTYKLDYFMMANRDFSGPSTTPIDQSNEILVEAGSAYYVGDIEAIGHVYLGDVHVAGYPRTEYRRVHTGFRITKIENLLEEASADLDVKMSGFASFKKKNGFMFRGR